MKISHPEKIDINSITTLIFDWGGVITPISLQRTMDAFLELGHTRTEYYFDTNNHENPFLRLETGEISPRELWEMLRPEFKHPVDQDQLEKAYCTLLLETPEVRIRLLQKLRSSFRLYLLSNTNFVHVTHYNRLLRERFQTDFPSLFIKTFYSHEMGMRKPDPEIFKKMLADSDADPKTALFLDDTKTNIETARSLGINSILIDGDHPIERIFSDWMT